MVLNYAGNAEKAEQVANEIKAANGQTLIIQADVSNEADVERMFKQILDTFGRIDVVVHTAGKSRCQRSLRLTWRSLIA